MGRKHSIPDPQFFFMALVTTTITMIYSCSLFTRVEGLIGINWGRQTSHRLIPSMVVDLLLQNGIRHLKLFSPSDNVLRAFAGGDIVITTTLPNDGLADITYLEIAEEWLETRIVNYQNQNINIRYLHIGTEPFSRNSRNITYHNAVDVLQFIQLAIDLKGYKNLTATTPHFTDVLTPDFKTPSDADFRPDIKHKMVQLVKILNQSNSPFVMNIFPIYTVSQRGWDTEFSFIENKSNFTITDDKTGLIYRNVFEFMYDSFANAIAKAGAPHLKLMVGQVGWPTDGYPGATVPNAERFFKEFLPYIKSNKGTPLKPGVSIDVFIHSLADENMNKIGIGAFQRHWGVYRSTGEPKYKIDFTGEGRDIYPTTAKGVISMPKRWCVFGGDTANLTQVKEEMSMACQVADCTSLSPGGSCSHLDFHQNVSYAFNGFFQVMAQAVNDGRVTCDFRGLGRVVLDDPSVGQCKFPVEILAADVAETDGVTGGGSGLRGAGRRLVLLPLILFILL